MAKCSWTFVLAALLIGACTGTQAPPPGMLPPPPARQDLLTRLYDQMASREDQVSRQAATDAAGGSDQDFRFLASLWGTRQRSALAAWRFADALAVQGHHQTSLDWYERAYTVSDAEDPMRHTLRYHMAVQLLTLGRNQDAVDLLANRLGTHAVPPDLQARYSELIRQAASD